MAPPFTIGAFTSTVAAMLNVKRPLRCRRHRLIVFTRYPSPGETKTRLTPALGDKGAALAQLCMTNKAMREAGQLQKRRLGDVSVEVRYVGGSAGDVRYWLGSRRDLDFWWSIQEGKDLGNKMANAFNDAFMDGTESVVLIGSDIPALTTDVLEEAFSTLESTQEENTCVIGPAKDGGYYLIGLNRHTGANDIDELFQEIAWGTDSVLQQQIQAAEQLGIHCHLLPFRLQDVDTKDDLDEFELRTGISRHELLAPSWTVIIPVLNEAKNVESAIDSAMQTASSLRYHTEVVVCDGGSTDGTPDIVRSAAQLYPEGKVKLVFSPKGRAVQMNTGVEHASGDYLLFLHADTSLPSSWQRAAHRTLSRPGVSMGAFQFGLKDASAEESHISSDSWWFRLQMRFLVWNANLKSTRFELPYGDQAFFMTKRQFLEVGGFPEFLLLEDVKMVALMKQHGHVAIAQGHPVLTSDRKWRQHGYFQVTARNICVMLAYKFGVHPDTLARWYYSPVRRLTATDNPSVPS
ncbi:DPM1 [Branchiostoma lanceolatum]|uniref:DPM1 protein n=1 Tax=Branchiostoma lanceolatum TaxID=7740 RepID=A0A8J9ZNF8_BRALA|nr:DPM1 [Branchiostoma lanceolatum]